MTLDPNPLPSVNPCPYRDPRPPAGFHCRTDAGLQAEYGPAVTCAVYWSVFEAQGGRCGACDRVWQGRIVDGRKVGGSRHFDTDHDHAALRLRGLLCSDCNKLLNEGVVREIARRAGQDVFRLSGGDWVTAGMTRYVRNPPAARLGLDVAVVERPRAEPAEPERERPRTRVALRDRQPAARGARVVMPDYPPPGERRRQQLKGPRPRREPEPVEASRGRRVAAVACLCIAVVCGTALAVTIIVKLLPLVLVLAVVGALAAGRR